MDRKSAKSPMTGAPYPKGPTTSSSMLYKKYKSKCANGLIDLFHLRRSYSKKLLSNGSRSNQNAESDVDLGNMLDLLMNIEEKCECTDSEGDDNNLSFDSYIAKTKELSEENLSNEQQLRKNVSAAKTKYANAGAEVGGDLSRDHGTTTKTSWRPCLLSMYGCYDVATARHGELVHKDVIDGSSQKMTSGVSAQATSNQMHPRIKEHSRHRRHDSRNEINLRFYMNEATEAFINQKLIDGKLLTIDHAAQQSKHFFDAFGILNSKKDLSLTLLHDPNSILVKHIEELHECQAKKRHSAIEAKDYRVKNFGSRAKYSVKSDLLSFDEIVVLRPRLASMPNCKDQTHHDSLKFGQSLKKVQQSVRPALFPLERLKRKLTKADRISEKEEQSIPSDHTMKRCTYNDMSMEVKEEDLSGIAKKIGSGVGKKWASTSESKLEDLKQPSVRYPRKKILAGNRILISESSSSGKAKFLVKHRPKSWAEMMHMPDYDFLPVFSPGKTWEHDSVHPQMRFSPYGNWKSGEDKTMRTDSGRDNNGSSPLWQNMEKSELAHYEAQCQRLQILETSHNISDIDLHIVGMHKNIFSLENDLASQKMETEDCESFEISTTCTGFHKVEIPSDHGSNQRTDKVDSNVEADPSGLSIMDGCVENLILSSPTNECFSSTSSFWRDEDSFSIKDAIEHSSPLSVLERYFTDEDTSPSSTESEHFEPANLPQQSSTEEEQNTSFVHAPTSWRMMSSTLNEEHDFVIQYIFEVLEASAINMDILASKYNTTDQFLDQIVWHKLEVWPEQFGKDHNLLFDFVVEILEYVHQHHHKCSPWVSLVLPEKRLLMPQESITLEVMNYVGLDMNLHPSSSTLQQLIERDLTRTGMWMDIGAIVEDIVVMMVESILRELVIEVA